MPDVTAFGTRRVVVTGLGVVSPLAHDPAELLERLCRGETGIRPIRRFDVSHCPSKVGALIEDLDPDTVIVERAGRRMLRIADWIQVLGICGAELAWRDARLPSSTVAPERLGVFFGTGRGGSKVTEEICCHLLAANEEWRGRRFASAADAYDEVMSRVVHAFTEVRPTRYLQQCPGFVSAYVAILHGARGPAMTNVNLCSAGAQAIGEAAWVIARDDADVMIAGGADSMLNAAELTAFCSLDAVSARNDDGAAACKPFDLRRDGCVVGEGGAVLVLEELGHARRRGARILAELRGYGASHDAHKLTAPPDDGIGAVAAMRTALRHARLAPADISHVNAHGTGTPLNDRVETQALKEVFGAHAYRMPIVSTKGATGHLIAGAGALEAAIAVQSLRERRVPPTLNLRVPDPRCDLDYATDGPRPMPHLRAVMSNSFALGGSNCALVFADLDA